MPVVLQRANGHSAFAETGAAVLDIGLINNMPDAALESTERQFVELLEAAAGNRVVRLRLLSLPQVPRSVAGRQYLDDAYSDIAKLRDSRLDGLIVTGTEPRAPVLSDEPYWAAFAQVADWAEANTASTIWSCLAAHAAVLHLDGVGRHALSDKRFGVFDCAAATPHALLGGVALPLRVAHSRWNELHENELAACGYTILTRAPEAGVDMFVKQRESLFVFFQGHPEYDPRALLREYRRDIGRRFLRGERDIYPGLPFGYVDGCAANALNAFRQQAQAQRREQLLDRFPAALVERRLQPFGNQACRIYANWLAHLAAEKAKRAQQRPYALTRRWRRDAAVQPAERLG